MPFGRDREGDFQRRWIFRFAGVLNLAGAALATFHEKPRMPTWGGMLTAIGIAQLWGGDAHPRKQKLVAIGVGTTNTCYIIATQVFKVGDVRFRANAAWVAPAMEAALMYWIAIALWRTSRPTQK